jgi:hypothetical protein
MEELTINSTKYTPEVKTDFHKGEVKFYGSSYPENANEFYQPVYSWIENYFEAGNSRLEVNFYIYYFNTSSSKCFMTLLEILEDKYKRGKDIVVNWYYTEEDEDGLDSGEALFMEVDLKYNFLPTDYL